LNIELIVVIICTIEQQIIIFRIFGMAQLRIKPSLSTGSQANHLTLGSEDGTWRWVKSIQNRK